MTRHINFVPGPETWHKDFPVAQEGKRQSPVDIKIEDIVEGRHVTGERPIKWKYTTKHCLSLENTGHSWKVNVDGNGSGSRDGATTGRKINIPCWESYFEYFLLIRLVAPVLLD